MKKKIEEELENGIWHELSYEINSKTNGRIKNFTTDTNTAIQWKNILLIKCISVHIIIIPCEPIFADFVDLHTYNHNKSRNTVRIPNIMHTSKTTNNV